MTATAALEQREIPRQHKNNAEIKSAFGERLLSTKDSFRYIHATSRELAEQILHNGLFMFSNFGFDGVAIPLSTNNERQSIQEISNTHKDAPVVVVIAVPNFRLGQEIKLRSNNGELPQGYKPERAFMKPNTQDNQFNYDRILDNQFIEGFYDKDAGEWVNNPLYWKNTLKKQQEKYGWTEEQYKQHHAEKLDEFKAKFIQQLKSDAEEFQKSQQEVFNIFLPNAQEETPEPRIP